MINITIKNLPKGDKKTAAIIEFLSNCQVDFSSEPVLPLANVMRADQAAPLPPDLKYRLYSSDLCSSEQTDDNTGEDDYGSYWLNDCTVEDIADWLCTQISSGNGA